MLCVCLGFSLGKPEPVQAKQIYSPCTFLWLVASASLAWPSNEHVHGEGQYPAAANNVYVLASLEGVLRALPLSARSQQRESNLFQTFSEV